jgi:hypothetical protein
MSILVPFSKRASLAVGRCIARAAHALLDQLTPRPTFSSNDDDRPIRPMFLR